MASATFVLTLGLSILSQTVSGKQLTCKAEDIPKSEYFGTKVTSITAKEVHGYNDWEWSVLANLAFEQTPVDFCNVTVTYTHPGLSDNVNVYVWLPLENWNGKFLAQGGGGWAAGTEGLEIFS